MDLRRVRSLTVRDVTDWLTEAGLLKQEESASGGKYRIPTDKGQEIGIAAAEKNGRNGRYFSVTYNVAAQTYLLDHMAEIAASGRDITVITNSAFIASFISGKGDSRVILLGGEYQKESQVMVGPLVRVCAATFHVDKLFAGADGFDPAYGFTAGDLMRTDAIKAMAQAARHTIVLVDHTKFEQLGLVMQLPFDAVTTVVTDERVPEEALNAMQKAGVEVVIAK